MSEASIAEAEDLDRAEYEAKWLARFDACTLCGVPLADATDVEAGYVTAFARDPADVTRCLSHGRTNLGASHG